MGSFASPYCKSTSHASRQASADARKRRRLQRSPTTPTSMPCQPPVNRRGIDATATSDEFRAFTVLDTAHRTLTHRLQRRVIQSPCIVPSHARRESYSPRRVKHEVYLLMYRLISKCVSRVG